MKGATPWIGHLCQVALAHLACTAGLVAEQFGPFTYESSGAEVTITDYPEDATGEVEIPATINEEPVTSIGASAFLDCSQITRVRIPDGVTEIGEFAFERCYTLRQVDLPSSLTSLGPGAFSNCCSLESARIPPGVATLRTLTFELCLGLRTVSFPPELTRIEQTAFIDCWSLSALSLPANLATIGSSSFAGCKDLENLIFPAELTRIEGNAFRGCRELKGCAFLGDAPYVGSNAFAECHAEFRVYFLNSRTGFTQPTWRDNPAGPVDQGAFPAASWLLNHGHWFDTSLDQDLNRDGVPLLMAFALNQDPNRDLSGSLPVPVGDTATLRLTFYAAAEGVLYRVETSEDLVFWTDEAVELSDLGADNLRTASVARTGRQQFIRLVVHLSAL